MAEPAKKYSRSREFADAGEAMAAVESLSYDGRGVAHLDGKAVFIEGALPGERVRFRYFNRRRNFDSGGAIEILQTSPDRATPPCPHFGVCGGCDLQHLQPRAQVQAKQQILAEQLAHIGRLQPETWLAPVTGPALGYRRRARLGVRRVPGQGGVLIGFRERHKSHLANLSTCLVLSPDMAGLLPEIRALIGDLSCANRVPQIEVAVGDGASALVFRHLVPLTPGDNELLRTFGQGHQIQIYGQGGGRDSIVALWPDEPGELGYRLPDFDVEIRFQPTDFVQINAAVNRQMVNQAVALLELTGTERVLDLFCGLGNFTLPLARRAGQVLGVEAEAALIEAGRRNARLNGLSNVEYRLADLDRADGTAPWTDFACDRLLLDPPRSGAMAAIKRLTAPLPARIVYVSCYPATLARDSQYLVQVLGYRFAAAGVLDMFPQTSHVETMALFVRP